MGLKIAENLVTVGDGYDVTGKAGVEVEVGDVVVSPDGQEWRYANSEGEDDVLYGVVKEDPVKDTIELNDPVTVRIRGMAVVKLTDAGCELGEYVECSATDGEVTVAEPSVDTDTSTDQPVEGLEAVVGRVKKNRNDSGKIIIEVL